MTTENILHFLKALTVLGLTLFAAGLYWSGAEAQISRVNTNMVYADQSGYMDYARGLYESDYSLVGGRNQMPVYPLLQSLFYRPNMSDEAFFERGKYVNLVLSLVLLAGIALIFRHHFSRLHSFSLLLIVAFSVFIFKAGFFQVELLFYFVNFCLFLLLWRLLQRASWRLAILTGVVAGLAHLTKASVLPALAIFAVLAVGKWGWIARRNRRSEDPIPMRFFDSHLVTALLGGLFFLLTVFPYINTSKKVFGHYFYNVNTTFYIWYDTWEEAKLGTAAHGDQARWPDMPPEEIPSMSKYWREHTLEQIADRFAYGRQRVLQSVVYSYGYHRYIVIYLCLLIIASAVSWPRARQAMASNPEVCLFLAMYFAAYLVFYTWYAPIADGNRLVLAQFLPLLFSLSKGLQTIWGSSRLVVRGYSLRVMTIINSAVLLIVVVDSYFITTQRVYTIYGGY